MYAALSLSLCNIPCFLQCNIVTYSKKPKSSCHNSSTIYSIGYDLKPIIRPLLIGCFLMGTLNLNSFIVPLLVGCFLMAVVVKKLRLMRHEDSTSLKMKSGAFYFPKDEKPPGEDAHFICGEGQTIGVADGVGEWALRGVDAGEYARKLMINSAHAVRNQPKGAVNPTEVLNEAYLKTNCQGSSTACILTLVGHHLHSANVGDSGFMVFRNGELVYQSPPQLHDINFPFQLGNNSDSDRPSSAEEHRLEVKSGDVVVVGTDGLFDNLHTDEILSAVNKGLEGGVEPQQLARTIAQEALHKSMDESADTPIARAFSIIEGLTLNGGKPDDITVIVAYIV